jgi:hypothetical protein
LPAKTTLLVAFTVNVPLFVKLEDPVNTIEQYVINPKFIVPPRLFVIPPLDESTVPVKENFKVPVFDILPQLRLAPSESVLPLLIVTLTHTDAAFTVIALAPVVAMITLSVVAGTPPPTQEPPAVQFPPVAVDVIVLAKVMFKEKNANSVINTYFTLPSSSGINDMVRLDFIQSVCKRKNTGLNRD